jgi:hypothetical protein
MAVIHTASRRAGGPNVCSYFVLEPKASENGNAKRHRRRAVPINEKPRVLFLGHTFWLQDQIVIGQVRYLEAIEEATFALMRIPNRRHV